MNTKTRALVESAVMVALSAVLSMIKVWEMPLGGSITLLSMLPVMLISIRHGIGWGLGAGFVYSFTQILTGGVFGWGLTAAVLIGALLLDYMLAFTVLGLAGVFKGKGNAGILCGVALSCVLRFLCHFIAGFILWTEFADFELFGNIIAGNPYLYSLCYNGLYMLPETVFTVVGVFILTKVGAGKKLFK